MGKDKEIWRESKMKNTNTFALINLWKGKNNPTIHIAEIPHEEENLEAWGINGPIVQILCGGASFHWPTDNDCTEVIEGHPMSLKVLKTFISYDKPKSNHGYGDDDYERKSKTRENLEQYFVQLYSVLKQETKFNVCKVCLASIAKRIYNLRDNTIVRSPKIPETVVVESRTSNNNDNPKVYAVALVERSLIPAGGWAPDTQEDLIKFFEQMNVHEHGFLTVAKTPEEAVQQMADGAGVVDMYQYFRSWRVLVFEVSVIPFVAGLEKQTSYRVYQIK